MDCKRKVSQVLNNINPQGSRLAGRPKTDGGAVYKHILINAELKTITHVVRSQSTTPNLRCAYLQSFIRDIPKFSDICCGRETQLDIFCT
jgi:hypothetical protein